MPSTLVAPEAGISLSLGQVYKDVTIDASALTADYLFNANGVSNVVVNNVKIINLGKTKGAIQFVGCSTVGVYGCTIVGGGRGITFDACDDVYALFNDIALTTDATSGFIGHGILYYANAADHAGANFSYNKIAGVQTYAHGIYGWGSDAATLANPVHASNIVVANNVIDTAQGGIWFSKCKSVSVTGNVVRNCLDVGIDFEGSLDSEAHGNTIKNCRNGSLACLYNSKRITFTGNNITSDLTALLGGGQQPTTSCISVYLRDSCEDILIEGNIFSSLGASRTSEIIIWKNAQATASKRILIKNNVFYNGLIQALDLNTQIDVEGNRFYFDFDVAAANSATVWIQKSSNCIIRNNKISGSADSASIAVDSAAQIYIDQNNVAAGTYQVKGIIVDGNEIRNFAGIYVSTKTGGSPDGGNYIIRNNIVNIIKHSSTTATASSVAGNVVPDTLAATTVTAF